MELGLRQLLLCLRRTRWTPQRRLVRGKRGVALCGAGQHHRRQVFALVTQPVDVQERIRPVALHRDELQIAPKVSGVEPAQRQADAEAGKRCGLQPTSRATV